jgi:hypothetical protein
LLNQHVEKQHSVYGDEYTLYMNWAIAAIVSQFTTLNFGNVI